jgi:glycosyltransferase A (GT-A) superfamily protein (DUF2064 family)
MLRAFRRSWDDRKAATVILGADSPTVPRRHVLEAFRRLETGARAVVSPSDDGGYVLIGLREPAETLFRDVPWGEASVLEITRDRATESGVDLAEVSPWYDVDEADDLRRLLREVADREGAGRAPSTARCLRGMALRLD